MKLNLRIVNLLVVIAICSFSTVVLAQKDKKTNQQPTSKTTSSKAQGQKQQPTAPSQTPDITVNKSGNDRPPSKGTGSDRPPSEGETLTQSKLVVRSSMGLLTTWIPSNIRDDYKQRLERTLSFVKSAGSTAVKLEYQFKVAGLHDGNSDQYSFDQYGLKDLQDVKNRLSQILGYLNRIEFEGTGKGKRVDAISDVNEALRLLQPFIDNPPPLERKELPKNKGGKTPVKGKVATNTLGDNPETMATSKPAEVSKTPTEPKSAKKPKVKGNN